MYECAARVSLVNVILLVAKVVVFIKSLPLSIAGASSISSEETKDRGGKTTAQEIRTLSLV